MSWPEFFFEPIDDTLAGIGVVTVSLILLTWGFSLLSAAYRDREANDVPRWHPRCWLVLNFEFFLGCFMVADATLYGLIGWTVLTEREPTDAWLILYLLVIAFFGVAAFVRWSRDRLPGSRRDDDDAR